MTVPDAATLAETVRRALHKAPVAWMFDGVSALDALLAALEQAQAERDEWKGRADATIGFLADVTAERDAAQAERDSLIENLRAANARSRELAERLAFSSDDCQRITHGRHCTCGACARENWARITSPCGMHGAGCPAVYAPLGSAGDFVPLSREPLGVAASPASAYGDELPGAVTDVDPGADVAEGLAPAGAARGTAKGGHTPKYQGVTVAERDAALARVEQLETALSYVVGWVRHGEGDESTAAELADAALAGGSGSGEQPSSTN